MPHNNGGNRSPITPVHKNITKEIENTKNPQSPRAPPLISKFRGESPPPPQKRPERPHTANEGTFFTSIGRSNRATFYIIHPEWASEAEGIMRLSSRAKGVGPFRENGGTAGIRTRRDAHLVGVVDDGEIRGGILPVDRGNESILTTARRAASHNPVWPHRCKSSPAQRSRNPITWV
ncbi:hypothetical protein Aperf_G00000073477 [Anoplocephala perfoliata]